MGSKNKRLIEGVIDWNNLMRAHHLARRGKRDRFEVEAFEASLWEELGALQMEMLWGTYQPGRYRSFVVYEPKKREILAAPYRDRVAQHAICSLCGPIWDRAMIYDSYACRPGKGTHAGAARLERWLRGMAATGPVWVVKMDVEKYFASISHRLCREVIREKISCPETLLLLDRIIASTADPADPDPIGIPVGNLTSQWLANLVGNRIDQWAKRELRLRRYIRYMDDMVVLVRTKREALENATITAELATIAQKLRGFAYASDLESETKEDVAAFRETFGQRELMVIWAVDALETRAELDAYDVTGGWPSADMARQ